jgi:DNA polymerase III subunit epsilon
MISARLEAIHRAKEILTLRPLFLDTETTGTGPLDEIVEIAIVDDDGGLLYETLIHPVGKVSPEARRIHNIDDGMLALAPRWMVVWPQVEKLLSGRAVCIYNADFDQRLIRQTHAKYKISYHLPEGTSFNCIMKLYAQYYGEWNPRTGDYRWQSLENAARQCRIPLPNLHRAAADNMLARALLHYMAEQS